MNSIGRIRIVEFSERDDLAFDEGMQVLNQHSNFEQFQLRNMPMLSLPGLDIYPDHHKVYRNSNGISLTIMIVFNQKSENKQDFCSR